MRIFEDREPDKQSVINSDLWSSPARSIFSCKLPKLRSNKAIQFFKRVTSYQYLELRQFKDCELKLAKLCKFYF